MTAGAVGALLLGRFIETLLFEVASSDPISVAAAGGIVAVIAMLSAFAAGRGAARIEPLVALRND